MPTQFQEKKFVILGLVGISDKQIEQHLALYSGYVKNTNKLLEEIASLRGKEGQNTLALSELTRRLGFEFNGMRLHELYFEQLTASDYAGSENLKGALTGQFGSFDAWTADFKQIAMMRGIGWALLMRDKLSGNLHNISVSDHENGHLAGADVIIALDIWEHAFTVDYLPTERAKYIEAFFQNMKWGVAENRYAI